MPEQPAPDDSERVRPDQPEPDTKDWTWTLERPCPECGYDAATVQPAAIPALVRDAMSRFPDALRREGATLRPEPRVWSPLEYGCHVRDVCRIFARRLHLMLEQDDPLFENWDQDATALQERYAEQDPLVVAVQCEDAAHEAADAFAAVADGQWPRVGRRSDGSVFTVESLGRYFLHDLYHHVHDLDRA